MIEPGRPMSLGAEEDRTDAEGLLTILRGCRTMRDHRHAGTTHVARQALWSFWELLRLPKPTFAGKYPLAYPWSRAAHEAHEAHRWLPRAVSG